MTQSDSTVLGARENTPRFFFSYARSDWTPFLQRFFEDLRAEVFGLGDYGQDITDLAFLDTHSIKTGQDFDSYIAWGLQVSKALVSVYSPNYFSRYKTHEYCAKEFAAFLNRNPKIHYEEVVEAGEKTYVVRDASNILPILWYSKSDLQRANDLPPKAVSRILFSLNGVSSELMDKYESKGLSLIARRRTSGYTEIVKGLARLIQEFSATPLPPMPAPPEFASLRNPFWDPPESVHDSPVQGVGAGNDSGSPDAIGQPTGLGESNQAPSVTAPTLQTRLRENGGPRLLFAIEVRSGEGVESIWAPGDGKESLSCILDEIASERRLVSVRAQLDPTQDEFLEQAQNALSAATQSNTTVVLLVDPNCLAEAETQRRLMTLLRSNWRGGFLLPVGMAPNKSHEQIERFCGSVKLSSDEEERIVFRKVVASVVSEVRSELILIVDEVVSRIVKQGQVKRISPDNAGPEKRPTISNVR